MKANDVCQLKYVEDSQALTNGEMGTGAQRFHPILPVSEQNFEEQAWLSRLLLKCRLTQEPHYNNKGKLHHPLIAAWWSICKEQSALHLPPFYSELDATKHASLRVDNVCLLKSTKGSLVLVRDRMNVGTHRLCLALPVSKQNFEERAWVNQWTDSRAYSDQD